MKRAAGALAAAVITAAAAGCGPVGAVDQFHAEWAGLSSVGQAEYCRWTVDDSAAFIAQAEARTGATEANDWQGLAEYMAAVQTACDPFYRY